MSAEREAKAAEREMDAIEGKHNHVKGTEMVTHTAHSGGEDFGEAKQLKQWHSFAVGEGDGVAHRLLKACQHAYEKEREFERVLFCVVFSPSYGESFI